MNKIKNKGQLIVDVETKKDETPEWNVVRSHTWRRSLRWGG
jgi:hypothetical protein